MLASTRASTRTTRAWRCEGLHLVGAFAEGWYLMLPGR
jgi:hypothetical protein